MTESLKVRLTQRYYRVRHRLGNRWMDALAVLAGYCNHCPWNPSRVDAGGGYSFWRCGLHRGHAGMHRSRNYVWSDDGRTAYVPVDNTAAAKLSSSPYADQPWNRHPSLTRRQRRLAEEWHERKRAELGRSS